MNDSGCPAPNGASSAVQPIHVFLLESDNTLVHIFQNVVLWGQKDEGSGLLLEGDMVTQHVPITVVELGANHRCQVLYEGARHSSTRLHVSTQKGGT